MFIEHLFTTNTTNTTTQRTLNTYEELFSSRLSVHLTVSAHVFFPNNKKKDTEYVNLKFY